jgi:hypothetical protein
MTGVGGIVDAVHHEASSIEDSELQQLFELFNGQLCFANQGAKAVNGSPFSFRTSRHNSAAS